MKIVAAAVCIRVLLENGQKGEFFSDDLVAEEEAPIAPPEYRKRALAAARELVNAFGPFSREGDDPKDPDWYSKRFGRN